ncbi:MAG: AIM24 family protein [Verrucomicrobia bacterium]|nr:AIM24 family protein [Verrucomicrobiota bacterium]
MAKEDMSSYNERISRARAELAKELNVKANAYQKMEDLNRWKPWPLDPRRIPWSWDYDYWNAVYQGADGAANRAMQAKESLERGLSEAKEGKWWIIGIAERAWSQSLGFLGVIVFGIVFTPGLWKAFWFYIAAPIASKAPPIQVAKLMGSHVTVSEPTTVQEVELISGNTICTRGDWVNAYPSEGVKKETRFLWSWRAPLVSYASGLHELTEWQIMGTTSQVLKLCSGTDPNLKIAKVIFSQSALVVRPSNIVAISGKLQLTTCWKLTSLHSWISGRLRHVIISGDGILYLCGYGDVHSETPQAKQRMSDNLLIAHDPRTIFRTVRTETFWPFLRGKTALYDLQFEDQGLVVYQAATRTTIDGKRPAHERFEGWIDLLLKPLGF